MTQFEGALIREQGIDFAVVIVKRHVLASKATADEVVQAFEVRLGRPVVLMAQDPRGRPTWYGRRDIVRFMSGVHLAAVRWQRITLH